MSMFHLGELENSWNVNLFSLLFFICYLIEEMTLQLNGDSDWHLLKDRGISLVNCLDVHENSSCAQMLDKINGLRLPRQVVSQLASSGTLGLFDCGWQDVMMADMWVKS